MIVISVDDLAQWAGPSSAYSSQIHTPNIDRLLDTGVNFTNAYTPEAICNAARTSTLSGLMTHNTGVHSNVQPWGDYITADQTWPAYFLEAGYEVGGFGKILHSGYIPGSIASQMFSDYQHLQGYKGGNPASSLAEPLPDPLEESDMADSITVDYAIEFLEDHGDESFMLNVGLFKPHLSWVVPQEYFDLYPIEDIVVPGLDGDDISGIPAFILDQLPGRGTVPETIEKAKQFMQGYLASVSFVDAQIGRLLDALEDEGIYDDTSIVLFSDHGFHLGDHDNTWGKFTLWEEAAKVPLVVKTAGNVNGGTEVDDPVNLVDIFPTIVEMAGMDPPDHLDGTSLMSLVLGEDGAEGPGFSVTWMYGSVLFRTDDYAYILYEDGSQELYDMIADPAQTVNLALDPAYADILVQQRAALYQAVPFQHVEGSVTGGAENDTFVLSDASDTAAGQEGNDLYFINNRYATVIEAVDEGIDTVFTSVSYAMSDNIENLHVKEYVSGAITVWGNTLDNFITLDGYDQVAYGGAGNDDIYSTCLRSEIYGEDGDDSIHGGYNDDILSGGSGQDIIYSGGGDDQLFGEAGDDFLKGSSGDSVLSGGAGDDIIKGGSGDEVLVGGSGADYMDGGGGVDLAAYWVATSGVTVDLKFPSRNKGDASGDMLVSIENMHGSSFDDQLSGNTAGNEIRGGNGHDTIDGRSGADDLSGGKGDDTLIGGLGNDALDGGDGADDLSGNQGSDALFGATGDDILSGDNGRDFLFGGSGNDILSGGADRDVLYGGDDNDILFGGSGGDTLSGDAGDDDLSGGSGRDFLFGGDGADILAGGSGVDNLSGGAGDDTLEGGSNSDVFVYSSGADVVLDFVDNVDTLRFDSALWGGGALTSKQILTFARVDGADVVFDFGDGNTLTVMSVYDTSILFNDIDYF